MCVQTLLALWNGGLMDLSKEYKIKCIKQIFAVILKAVLARCNPENEFYWRGLFEETENLFVAIIHKNPEDRKFIQLIMDREILCIVNRINALQANEEKHSQYIERRKNRKPTYSTGKDKKKHKHKHKHDDDDSSSSSSDED